jgi:hypothetical protein
VGGEAWLALRNRASTQPGRASGASHHGFGRADRERSANDRYEIRELFVAWLLAALVAAVALVVLSLQGGGHSRAPILYVPGRAVPQSGISSAPDPLPEQ